MANRTVARLALLTAAALLIAGSGARAFADDLAEGRTLYVRYCASCHGVAGDGRGPVARALTEQPGDLTKLGERFGTPLPAGQIARYIDGRYKITAHGERDMPVWGQRFSEIWSAKTSREGDMDNRIRRIIRFIDSLQKPSIPSETPRAPVSSIR